MSPAFVPGLELSRAFYGEVVKPIVEEAYPDLRYSAALIGKGSEVLGLDTERSTDHDWGPRLQVFLSAGDHGERSEELDTLFGKQLPTKFKGHPTGFGPVGPDGARLPDRAGHRPVAHRVEVHELGRWFHQQLGFDPRGGVAVADWLLTPSQLLLEVTAGEVFHDGLRELAPVRAALTWPPDDVWRYLLAAQWRRIAQEESFLARAGEIGDELGARLVAARLARDVVRLCFLMERRHAPFTKWLGSMFGQLAASELVGPALQEVLAADDAGKRQAALNRAYELVATGFNSLGLCAEVDPTVRAFHRRPYLVLGADRFAEALRVAITDPEVRGLPDGIGAVDQWIDATDVLTGPRRARLTRAVYGPA